MLAFDCTYLTSTLSHVELHSRCGMVGGVWSTEDPMNSFIELTEETNVGAIRKASNMCEFLVWDMSAKKKSPLSVCSLPVEINFSGCYSGYRGNMYMLHLTGLVLQENDGMIKAVVCDAHGTHAYLKKLMFGQLKTLPMEDIKQIPFWGELQFQDLPHHGLPHLPIKLATHAGEVLWGIPGVCDLDLLFVVSPISG